LVRRIDDVEAGNGWLVAGLSRAANDVPAVTTKVSPKSATHGMRLRFFMWALLIGGTTARVIRRDGRLRGRG
jgi:hypothetical protein